MISSQMNSTTTSHKPFPKPPSLTPSPLLLLSSSFALLAYMYIGYAGPAFTIYTAVGFLLVAAVVGLVVARAAVVAWITVLVLLAFAGNRRRVLVREGRNITADVGKYVVNAVMCEPGGAVICCTVLFAVVVSLLAVVGIVESLTFSHFRCC